MKRRLRRRARAARRSRDRRGVLLLVVLSMLVLFLLIGTAFLVVSNQYRSASKVIETANRTTFQPDDLLERALMQLLRDTNNRHSALRYHSLLRDLYGVDGFMARTMAPYTVAAGAQVEQVNIDLGGASFDDGDPSLILYPHFAGATVTAPVDPLGPTGGHLIDFYVHDANGESVTSPTDRNAVGLHVDEDGLPVDIEISSSSKYYEGALLTFVTGACRGSTVRVVDCEFVEDGVGYASRRNPAEATGTDVPAGRVVRLRTTAPHRIDGRPLTVDPTTGGLNDLVDSATLGVRFIVNGRPFNGAGVGYNPLGLAYDFSRGEAVARNSALELFETVAGSFVGLECALTPNSRYFGQAERVTLDPGAGRDPWPAAAAGYPAGFLSLREGFATAGEDLYKTFAGPGDTDESYDAADFQNMLLASQALEPRLRGRVVDPVSRNSVDPDAYYPAGAATAPLRLDLEGVTIPSLHRPALVNFWFHRLWSSTWLSSIVADDNQRVRAILQPYDANGDAQHGLDERTAAQIAAIKRRFMMRPLREDHPDFDGSNSLSRYGTPGIAAGLAANGLVNNGEITFPYWESVGPWDVDNDGDGVPDSVWVDIGLPVQQTEDGRWYKPLVAVLVEDLDGRLNVNAHGSVADMIEELLDFSSIGANLAQDYQNGSLLTTSNQLPEGDGWGPAEVSLRSILSPTLPVDEFVGGAAGPTAASNPLDVGYTGNPQYDDYARVMFGRPSPSDSSQRGDAAFALNVSETYGRYGSAVGTDATYDLTGPGRTFTAAPVTTPTQIVRDARTPLDFSDYPTFTNAGSEPLNGYATAPDLRGRYAGAGVLATGAAVAEPVHEANSVGLTWREQRFNAVDDSPYEIDLSGAARRLAPVSLSSIRNSYETTTPLVDDAPFSAAELERILRAFDADADTLPDRLWNTIDAVDPDKLAAATAAPTAPNASGPTESVRANILAGSAVANDHVRGRLAAASHRVGAGVDQPSAAHNRQLGPPHAQRELDRPVDLGGRRLPRDPLE